MRLSTCATCLLAIAGDRFRRLAAAVKLRSSATVQNTRRLVIVSMIINSKEMIRPLYLR
ncbi:hypothetical protein ACCP88_11120 [Xanthomonas axonopodis pv. cyamopsidis]